MKLFRYLSAGMLLITLGRTESKTPLKTDAEVIVEEFEGRLKEIEKTFQEKAGNLKASYVDAMSRIQMTASKGNDVETRLWAYRLGRVAESSESEWLALLHDDFDLPEKLVELNTQALSAVDTLREALLAAMVEAKEKASRELLSLEKKQVRANQIDAAVKTHETAKQIVNSKIYTRVEKRISRFQVERAKKEIRNKEKKLEWDPIPPPDARFPFRRENPAFESLLKSVEIESSGFQERPSSGIKIGNLVTYRGTRGLAVVAVYGSEVLIKDTYDTYASEEESNRLIEDLKELPYGTFLILAVRDDATRRFTGSAQSTLIRFGAGKGIAILPYRSSYYMIGLKGLEPGQAIEVHNTSRIKYDAAVQ